MELRQVLSGSPLGVEELDLSITSLAAPVATDDAAIVDSQQPTISVLDNDTYDGALPEVIITTPPSNGYWDIDDATGVVTYTGASGFTGTDSFKYQLKDSTGQLSNEATVNVTWADYTTVDLMQLTTADSANFERWYHLEATHDAKLTAQAVFDLAKGNVQMTLYRYEGFDLSDPAASKLSTQNRRIDYNATAGEEFYLKVTGTPKVTTTTGGTTTATLEVDLRLANVFQQVGGAVTVYGTSGDDKLEFSPTSATITDVTEDFSIEYTGLTNVASLHFAADEGDDEVVLYGTTGDDTFEVSYDATSDTATATGAGLTATLQSVATMTVDGKSGTGDAIDLRGSSAEESFNNSSTPTWLIDDFTLLVKDFDTIRVHADSSDDVASLYDSSGDDTLTATPGSVILVRTDYRVEAHGFAEIGVTSTAGTDSATLTGGSDDEDLFEANAAEDWAAMTSGDPDDPTWKITVTGFARVEGIAAGSTDSALFTDSSGDDEFHGTPDATWLADADDEPIFKATGFPAVTIVSTTGGTDTATLEGSDGNDLLEATPYKLTLSNASGNPQTYSIEVWYFDSVSVDALSGTADTANLSGNTSTEAFSVDGTADTATFSGADYSYSVVSFNLVVAEAKPDGEDTATFLGSKGDDVFVADPSGQIFTLTANGIEYQAKRFRQVTADGQDGNDQVTLKETAGDDTLTCTPTDVTYTGTYRDQAFSVTVTGFEKTAGNDQLVFDFSTTGTDKDTASFSDSEGDDTFRGWTNGGSMKCPSVFYSVNGFYAIHAEATAGGTDTAWLFDSAGDDVFTASPTTATLTGDKCSLQATGFDVVLGVHSAGGTDTATLDGSDGDDRLLLRLEDRSAQLIGDGFDIRATRDKNATTQFETITVHTGEGADTVEVFDSAKDDTLTVRPGEMEWVYEWEEGEDEKSVTFAADGFESLVAYANTFTGDKDVVNLYDSSGNDTLEYESQTVKLTGTDMTHEVHYFEEVKVIADAGGTDTAELVGSDNTDVLTASAREVVFVSGLRLTVTGFDEIEVDAKGGTVDTATLTGSTGDDRLTVDATEETATFAIPGMTITMVSFNTVTVEAKADGTDTAELLGSAGDDTFVADPTERLHTLTAGGATYTAKGFATLTVDGRGGSDTVDLRETVGDDTLTIRPESINLSGTYRDQAFSVTVAGFEKTAGNDSLTFDLGTLKNDADTAVFYDGKGNDTLKASMIGAQMVMSGVKYAVNGYTNLEAHATAGGNDTAWLFDSKPAQDSSKKTDPDWENDVFTASPTSATLTGAGFSLTASGFDLVRASAVTGEDTATLEGSDGDDTLDYRLGDRARLYGDGFDIRLWGTDVLATSFKNVAVDLGEGDDTAVLMDSPKNDTLTASGTSVEFVDREISDDEDEDEENADGFVFQGEGIDQLLAYALGYKGDRDTARLYDTTGNDTLDFADGVVTFTGTDLDYKTHWFYTNRVYANSGGSNDNDVATMIGSEGTDSLTASPDLATFSTHSRTDLFGYVLEMYDFNELNVDCNGGNGDWTVIYDTSGDDTFTARPGEAEFKGADYVVNTKAFDFVHAISNAGGYDKATFYGSAEYQTLMCKSHRSIMNGRNFLFTARDFDEIVAYGEGGGDYAMLYDGKYNDSLFAKEGQVKLSGYRNASTKFSYEINSFAAVRATGNGGGYNTLRMQGNKTEIYKWLNLGGSWNDIS